MAGEYPVDSFVAVVNRIDHGICFVLAVAWKTSHCPLYLHCDLLCSRAFRLRSDDDVVKAVEFYNANSFELVKSVSEVDAGFLKYGSLNDKGEFIPVAKPEYCFTNRQDLPNMVRPNGAIYVFNSDTIVKNCGMASQSIGAVLTDIPIDIDVHEDLMRAEKLINGSK